MRLHYPALLTALVAAAAAACSGPPPREYELHGQVIAVDRARLEITIKHDDIPRFMPGMTMPFKVRDGRLLDGPAPGDLVKATLVVEDTGGYLRTIERTGSAPLPAAPPARSPHLLLNPGDVVPEAALVDETGAPRRLLEWRNRVLAVTFVYTRCPFPDFCPLMDRHFQAVQRVLAADPALRGRVRLLSVSIDPEYDRPPVLAAHARRVGADPAIWSFLTGSADDVEAFAWRFGVSITREGRESPEVVHNLRTAVIDEEGRLTAVLRGNEWTPDQLVAELRKAADGRR